MTSFGANEQYMDGFMPTFKVKGQIYHRLGSILPLAGEEHKFLQIYFMGDSERETSRRCEVIHNLHHVTVADLQAMLHAHNPHIVNIKTRLDVGNVPDLRLKLSADRAPQGEHPGRFNAPTVNEVAVLIAGDAHEKRDIVLRLRDESVNRIADTHRSYDSLQYPLLLPYGEDGYHFLHRQVNAQTRVPTSKKVTASDFYAYKLMVRNDSFNTILRGAQLFHQYIVDMYVKIESERLSFIRFNQASLRADNYVHLRDAISNDGNPANVRRQVILPATFTGGPRYMKEKTQDAMTYVRERGRPQLFITATCNPKWPEIAAELFDAQSPHDRNDLIARVFRLKSKLFMDVLTKGELFGLSTCNMHTIEWQKRGLPHMHALLWLQHSIQSADVDDVVCAEIPSAEDDPVLHDLVKKHMIHGPCGALNTSAPCMKDGKCSKGYPKPMVKHTQTDRDGYPLYRRRSREDGGSFTVLKIRNEEVEVDNRWVVPYNPVLLRLFSAHINVEVCNSVKAIKYITKYINKGSDQAVFGVQNENDEVSRYQTGRYVSSSEAVWPIFGFPIHGRYPTVTHLAVHLENGQRVYFTEETAHTVSESPPETTLTAFFKLCATDAFARTLLYNSVPSYFVWDAQRKKFKRRKVGTPVPGYEGVRKSDALGRVYAVHPRQAECYYLRLLLHTVHGPTSFDDVRTVDDQVCETYRQACQLRGLLQDDEHWLGALLQAAESSHPAAIRHLFSIMSFCEVSDPLRLWNEFREAMSEDYLQAARRQEGNEARTFSQMEFDQCLCAIQTHLLTMCGRTLVSAGLPDPSQASSTLSDQPLARETNYDRAALLEQVRQQEPTLTDDQRLAYDAICDQVQTSDDGLIFLDAPGGTGKTYVTNLLLAKVRSGGHVALAVASSAIAATLLAGGRTAHSTFALPLDLHRLEEPTCSIAKDSEKAALLREAVLIVWDECTMSHKHAFEAVDRTLRDLRSSNSLMGGVTVVMSGDFRQTLPIVPRGTSADEINACIKSSALWRSVVEYTLTTNMRVLRSSDTNAGQFSAQLLKVGNGAIPVLPSGEIAVPGDLAQIAASQEDIVRIIYPDVADNFVDPTWLKERAILAPLNDTVTDMNGILMHKLPGDLVQYESVDTVEDDDSGDYPVEFLNSCNPSGLPSHLLQLKVGVPVMLLRNLDAPKLCNGTRL